MRAGDGIYVIVCEASQTWGEIAVEGPAYFYANALEMGASQYDVTLRFFHNALPLGSTKEGRGEPQRTKEVEISMSPQHAKAMIGPLLEAIVEYEKAFGTISITDEQREKLKGLLKTATKSWA